MEVTSLFVKSYLNCLLPEKHDYLDLADSSLKKLQSALDAIDKPKLK